MVRDELMEKGYGHVYIGNGKGKTIAMLGLALGLPVYIEQFMKRLDCSELKCSGLFWIARRFPGR